MATPIISTFSDYVKQAENMLTSELNRIVKGDTFWAMDTDAIVIRFCMSLSKSDKKIIKNKHKNKLQRIRYKNLGLLRGVRYE